MNDKITTKIHNFVTNCLECADLDDRAIFSSPKLFSSGYCVDLSIENYNEEDVMCLVGFLAQSIGMKNIWFDTYPKTGRVDFELNFDEEFLAR